MLPIEITDKRNRRRVDAKINSVGSIKPSKIRSNVAKSGYIVYRNWLGIYLIPKDMAVLNSSDRMTRK